MRNAQIQRYVSRTTKQIQRYVSRTSEQIQRYARRFSEVREAYPTSQPDLYYKHNPLGRLLELNLRTRARRADGQRCTHHQAGAR